MIRHLTINYTQVHLLMYILYLESDRTSSNNTDGVTPLFLVFFNPLLVQHLSCSSQILKKVVEFIRLLDLPFAEDQVQCCIM